MKWFPQKWQTPQDKSWAEQREYLYEEGKLNPVETDQVFPPHLSATAVETLRAAGLDADLFMLKCNGGHLDGLTQMEKARGVLTDFLA